MPARLPKLTAWVCLVPLWAGCQGPQPDQPNRGNASAPRGVVVLSPEAQGRAGVVVEAVSKVREPSFLAATGWLVARPGAEVAVKAPATGLVTLGSGKEGIGPGRVIENAGEPLGAIQVVLSPQEQAALVAAKEDVDVIVRQSLTTLELAEAQLQRVQESKEAVPGTRLAELREKVEHARAA